MKRQIITIWVSLCTLAVISQVGLTAETAASKPKETIAVIGTGDMGNSFGPCLAALGYQIVYGSRNPESNKVKALLKKTGHGAIATTQKEAAQQSDIVMLLLPWPAMETVAQNLGSLDDKIVIDISFPHKQGEDGYYVPMLETSSAEMIQQWNPGARVMKTFALQASYVIDDPGVVGGPVTIPIAADDREAKEQIASLIVEMGHDPIDAGPFPQ